MAQSINKTIKSLKKIKRLFQLGLRNKALKNMKKLINSLEKEYCTEDLINKTLSRIKLGKGNILSGDDYHSIFMLEKKIKKIKEVHDDTLSGKWADKDY